MTAVTSGQMGFGMHTGIPIRILRQVQTTEYQMCRMWTGGTLAWALSSKKVASCRISEHAPEQEKRRYVCLVWLRVDRSHQRQLRGFTTEPLLRRKRARHSGRKALFRKPLGERALRPRSVHRKHPGPCARCLLACASFEIREFLEIVALCPTSLAFDLSQVSRKGFSCRGSQRSSTRRVDVSRREQKARQAQWRCWRICT